MSEEQYPLISIYIPTHNRLSLLKRAIKSVQDQIYPNIEIIVCDDASTDGTEQYVLDIMRNDERIKYYKNEVALGACAARNIGIFKANGFFITGLDDDDEFTPDRLIFLYENWSDEYSFICCNFIDVYTDNKVKSFYPKGDFLGEYKDLLFENVCSNQVFTLTERLREINGFDVRVKRLQDWDTWLRLSFKYGKFKRFGDVKYIMHHDTTVQRVSHASDFSSALRDLKLRNLELYQEEDYRYMTFLEQNAINKTSFKDTFYWSIRKKKLKYIVKFFAMKVKKIIK